MDLERPADTYDDDSIDLRKYVLILFRRWRLILLLTLVAATVATVMAVSASLTPPPYEAVSGVAIVKTASDIVFEPRFLTVGDTTASGVAAASSARRSALLSLVQNGAIASQVITQLGSQLGDNERNPAALMDKVKADVPQQGDLILIRVRDQNAAKAAAIANAWAQEYERSINSIYGGSPAGYNLSVQAELARTRQTYDHAQSALERFLATDRVEALTRQISDTQGIANALADARVNSQTTAISQESLARTKTLREMYATQLRVRMLAEDARAMRDQVRAGGEPAAASNGLALQLLKTQAFALSAGLPGQLQLQTGLATPATTAATQLADLEALIGALEKRDVTVTSAVAAQSQALLSAEEGSGIAATATLTTPAANRTVLALQAQVRSLQSALEQERATSLTLTQARDLAWSTYSTLANKQAEVTVAAAISSSEVRFALPAVPPTNRVQSPSTSVLVVVLVGLLLGVMAAFAVEFLLAGGPPPRNRLWRWILG
jgi:capsular polysaccharide biosynthesis protein